jgi:hypothetical protein
MHDFSSEATGKKQNQKILKQAKKNLVRELGRLANQTNGFCQ